MRTLFGLVAATFLPAPERDRLAFRLDLPLAAWAAAFCLVATVAGGIAWALGWLRWMEAATGQADATAVAGQPDATVGALMFLGPLQALAYIFTPTGAGLGYLTVSGLVRCAAWSATREVPGDPVVTLALALGRALRGARVRFHALPGDIVRTTGEETLEIVCPRARPDLALGASVEVDGRFYEVVGVAAVRVGKRSGVAHRLRAMPPESVLRGLVRYR